LGGDQSHETTFEIFSDCFWGFDAGAANEASHRKISEKIEL
jgi:hypothetical protein